MKIINQILEWSGLLGVIVLLGAISIAIAIASAGLTLAKFAIAFHLLFGG